MTTLPRSCFTSAPNLDKYCQENKLRLLGKLFQVYPHVKLERT